MTSISKIQIFLLIVLFASCQNKSKTVTQSENNESKTTAPYHDLEKLPMYIDSLYVVDQQVQNDIQNAFKNGIAPDSMKVLYALKDSTFVRHTKYLKLIYQKHGYPTHSKIGELASSHFFTMVQHADHDVDFQKQMLSHIEAEVTKGNVSGESFAFLTDRVLLANNQPQLYGTQMNYDDKGNAFPRNLADPETCNERRAKYGLEPLEDYLADMTALQKQMNPGKYD